MALHDPAIDETAPENIELYGVDRDGPLPVESLNVVEVDPPQCLIPQHTSLLLQQTVDPLQESSVYGIDLNMQAIALL